MREEGVQYHKDRKSLSSTEDNSPMIATDQLLREALSIQLAQLEELRDQYLGEPKAPKVCVVCYMVESDCSCDAPMKWTLTAALYKLRAELGVV